MRLLIYESHIGRYKKAIGYTDVDPHEELVTSPFSMRLC